MGATELHHEHTDPYASVNYLNRAYIQLAQYFGGAWCIPQHAIVTHLHMTPNAKPIPAYVLIQQREPAFYHPSIIRMDTPYIELLVDHPAECAAYVIMNEALLGAADPDIASYLHFNPGIRPCIDLITHDNDFKQLIQPFLLRFKAYTTHTGEIIDMVGERNVFAYRETPSTWTLRIGSVIKSQRHGDLIATLARLATRTGHLPQFTRADLCIVLNRIAVYRLINALAIQSGIGRLFDLALSSEQLAALVKVRFQDIIAAGASDNLSTS